MIVNFKHKGLKLFWEENDRSKIPAALINKIDYILDILYEIEELHGDLEPFPGLAAHPLKGDLAGFWSVKVNKNFRIIFRFENKHVLDVDYIDYH